MSGTLKDVGHAGGTSSESRPRDREFAHLSCSIRSTRPAAHGQGKRLLIVTHTGEIGGAEYVMLDVAQHYGSRCHVLLFAAGPLTKRLSTLGICHTVLSAGTAIIGLRRESKHLRALAAVPSVVGLAPSP
jgi:hypothetical protein